MCGIVPDGDLAANAANAARRLRAANLTRAAHRAYLNGLTRLAGGHVGRHGGPRSRRDRTGVVIGPVWPREHMTRLRVIPEAAPFPPGWRAGRSSKAKASRGRQ
jgi:hypothetical protein